uniref:BCL2 associated agonist of cell death b n=1 Tax=Xiphophorus couchianus TaxID=32473 RepID=A0A3B5L9R9_9TELE
MDTKFTISDGESDPSEDVEERGDLQLMQEKEKPLSQRHTLTLPELRSTKVELQARGEEEVGTPTEGFPFRGRSLSAPPSLWAAKKYGRQLRRMSDEFVNLLDKGEMRNVSSDGSNRPIHHSRSWWSYLFSHQETEGENNHHENHASRTE